ncbi:MAG: TIGR03790 family protein [Tepidisphaeraceae bacterium]
MYRSTGASRGILLLLTLLFGAVVAPRAARALTPDELLLVVNKNAPQSVKLAEYYAVQRKVPPGRIVGLNLPAGEEIPFERYERDIVPPVRQFLRDNRLQDKVKCLVVFYGVPIRVAAKVNTPREREELTGLQDDLKKIAARAEPLVVEFEKLAKEADETFVAPPGKSLDELVRRADQASRSITANAARVEDPTKRAAVMHGFLAAIQQFAGNAGVVERIQPGVGGMAPTTQDLARWTALRQQLDQLRKKLADLQEHRYDPDARQELRVLVRDNLGLFNHARLLQSQIEYLSAEESVSAVDSELALLWWPAYPRTKWQFNPMYFRAARRNGHFGDVHPVAQPGLPSTLMVMRLDGPDEGAARDIIIASLKAEREGLDGTVVIDSRGIPKRKEDGSVDGYGDYDQTLRDLASLVRGKTKLPLFFDDKPAVLPANAVKNVALYCGWYNLRSYVPTMTFKPGAVGYHVASFEMLSLHADNERGWVRGLLNDGIASTLGPVAEPYLHSFPKADEFFPLLMTGKLTLAEVYWKTQLMTSWMTSCIGDPLYNPFKNKPAVKVEDLPRDLQEVFDPPATHLNPTTLPVGPTTQP